MGTYLDKFNSAISQKQAQQILELLNKKRNSGQIRNIKEFSEQLSNLMSELTATTLQPTTKLFLAEAENVISSEQYNFMLDRIDDDLEAAFVEANNISTIQESHEVIVRDVILKNLRAGISELEAKINLYEILNRDTNGFDTALFSTFRESRDNRTQSGTLATSVLFSDPRKSTTVEAMSDATTELVGERLVLGNDSVSYYDIAQVKQLFDSESPQSEMIIESPKTPLSNIIDNTKGTFWIQNLIFSTEKEYVKVKVEFDLGIVREFNFIEIEPASNNNLVLESIYYLSNNNTAVSLTNNEVEFNSPISIRIKKTSSKKIILTFRCEHFQPIQFQYENSDTLIDQALSSATPDISIKSIQRDLENFIPSTDVQSAIGMTARTSQTFSGYEFIVGLDNVRVGLAEYLPSSIYISKPITLSSVGQIGLKTDESRPYNNNGIISFTSDTYTNTNFIMSSIEYWVIKQDFSTDGSLLQTVKFPILPLNVGSIKHERLILTEKSSTSLSDPNIGYTSFFTNRTAGEGNIVVYRNGVVLTDETDTASPTDGWQSLTTATEQTPNNGAPMRFKIKIVDPLPGDIFTVSYNPITSTTRSIPNNLSAVSSVGGLQIIDLVGDMSAYADEIQLITINDPDATNTTKEVKIYLAIVLRQNTADTSISAAVEEYTLMIGKHDLTKYEDS